MLLKAQKHAKDKLAGHVGVGHLHNHDLDAVGMYEVPSRRKGSFVLVRGRRSFNDEDDDDVVLVRSTSAERSRTPSKSFKATAATFGKRNTGRFAIVRGR